MKRVMVFSTYPIKNAQHGGQKRLKAIVDEYKNAGHTVRNIAIFDRVGYKEFGRYDISLTQSSIDEIRHHPWTGDIIAGNAVHDDDVVRKKVIHQLLVFLPDIIHIEQPYVYLGLKKVLSEVSANPVIVYGSQNIEAPMKEGILTGQKTPRSEIKDAVKIIDDIERQLVSDASYVLACTKADCREYRKMGASQKTLILAENGIAVSSSTPQSIEKWKKLLKKGKVERTTLFVASAHPPSITGFIDMVGKGLGFMKNHDKLLIAGSISDYFQGMFKKQNLDVCDVTFWLKAIPCGRVSEDDLGALLRVADVIVLPITEGGGSNLKTAEALLARKKVVTTSFALRSFEWAKELPNVWVVDDSDGFRAAINQALDAPFVDYTDKQLKKIETVLWKHRLAAFRQKMEEL